MASSQPEGQTTAAHWMGYVVGPVHPNTQDYATFETKPTENYTDDRHDTGGGYERWRSIEYRPETRVDRKEDVYVPHHRLLAVVACYPSDVPLGEVLDDLRGRDVHHNAPEVVGDRGVEWDNRPGCLEVLDHGRHSQITQQELLRYAKDRKQRVESEESAPIDDADDCRECGSDGEARVDGLDGVFCLGCATDRAGDGRTVEVL